MHITYESELRDVKGLLNYSMLLVFTLLCVISQAKALTFDEALDFHINLA